MSLLAVTIWAGHNNKVSTSIIRIDGLNTADGRRVGVLVRAEVVSHVRGRAVLIWVLVVLTAKLLEDATGSGAPTAAAGSSHSRDQVWVTESGVVWAKGRCVRVFSKDIVFTFTCRRCGREGPWDRLLARFCRAGSGASVLLVC